MKKYEKIISIGWDVGGWLGSGANCKNALSVLKYEEEKFSWGEIELVSFANGLLSFEEVCDKLKLGPELCNNPNVQIVIAIDAPLGFPAKFKELVNGSLEDHVIYREGENNKKKMINNLFAFRKTEQYLFEKFKKQSLSATFDKLGNNSTVAIAHRIKWAKSDNFIFYPFCGTDFPFNCARLGFEVYPGVITKDALGDVEFSKISELITLARNGNLIEDFTYYIDQKSGKSGNSDLMDSAICAILGMARVISHAKLPAMETEIPNEDIILNEGWIIHPKIKKII